MNDTDSVSSLSLQPLQRDLLQALVGRHTDSHQPVKRATLAEDIDCHPVTVSKRMQELRALDLVRSLPGPKGGYEPTVEARDALVERWATHTVQIPVVTATGATTEVSIREIALPRIWDPNHCRAVVSFGESSTAFGIGDSISIGPLPTQELSIKGVVVERHPAEGTVTIEVETMQAPSRN